MIDEGVHCQVTDKVARVSFTMVKQEKLVRGKRVPFKWSLAEKIPPKTAYPFRL